ncbi:MAG: hypothetical protein U0746_06765 [Gemmataceae bacterium]
MTALGLLAAATLFAFRDGVPAMAWLGAATAASLVGAVSWTFEPAPLGRTLIVACTACCTVSLFWLEPPRGEFATNYELPDWGWVLVGVSSAALLGTTLTAMLVGHSYLIAPGLSLRPLMLSLGASATALAVRVAVVAGGLTCWTADSGAYTLNDVGLWLPVRWLVGFAAPLGFVWMAYSAAKIRSTQSATGILYVAVVCIFLGELMSLLLTRQTGLPL